MHVSRRAAVRSAVAAGAILICAIAAGMFSHQFLWALGAALDGSEAPQKADIVVVLAGDVHGGRILEAGELIRAGLAPRAFVSGANRYFGRAECDIQIDFAAAHGYPREYFIPFQHANRSTAEEAATEVPELRKLGVRKYLLVTNAWHTARALRLFRRAGPELDVHAVSVPDRAWHDGNWWIDRQGRKVWVLETAKTVAGYLGL